MILWGIAAVCAFFVKGLCGFANTLVFTTILSFQSSNVNISPIELLLGYPSNMILAWKERRSIQWNICLPLVLLVIAGSVPGVLFLKNAGAGMVKVIFGAVIIVVGLEMLLREFQTKKRKQSKVVLGVIGILSGLLCGLYGVGALLGAYVSRVTDGNSAFKANMSVVFFVENTFRILLYSLWGIITPGMAGQVLRLLPFVLAGLALGMYSERFLDEKMIRRIVVVMLIVSGVALIVNNG